jgi:mannose PTS system EIIA component
MARLFIVAHAPLATALRAVAQHAYPDCGGGTDALDVLPGDTAEAVEAGIRARLAAPGEVLILADVFGATPCNAALAAADGTRVRVVAGVSVPMLWRTLCYQGLPLDDLVTRAVAGGSQGAMHVAVPRRQNQAAPAHHHDQDPHHDQQ